jgi:hypothetical protein
MLVSLATESLAERVIRIVINASFNPEPTATALAGARVNAGYPAVNSPAVAVGSGLNDGLRL